MFVNTRHLKVEWSQCDPAGIVYFPRYFEMFDNATTALFEQALGMSKFKFLQHYHFVGYALADTNAKFFIPTRFGDAVTLESTVKAMRRASFDVQHRLLKDGALAAEGNETRVWVGHDPANPGRIKAQSIPDEVVAKLAG